MFCVFFLSFFYDKTFLIIVFFFGGHLCVLLEVCFVFLFGQFFS